MCQNYQRDSHFVEWLVRCTACWRSEVRAHREKVRWAERCRRYKMSSCVVEQGRDCAAWQGGIWWYHLILAVWAPLISPLPTHLPKVTWWQISATRAQLPFSSQRQLTWRTCFGEEGLFLFTALAHHVRKSSPIVMTRKQRNRNTVWSSAKPHPKDEASGASVHELGPSSFHHLPMGSSH